MCRLLIYTATVTPFRVAFYDVDSDFWIGLDIFIDSCFLLDIILNFFTAYFDAEDELVLDRKNIAIHYITGWLFVDFISILPVSFILQAERDYTSLGFPFFKLYIF
jgi:hypothetical protein